MGPQEAAVHRIPLELTEVAEGLVGTIAEIQDLR